MLQLDGKSKQFPEGWKIKTQLEGWKNQEIFYKDGKSINIPERWKIIKCSRSIDNQKIFRRMKIMMWNLPK